MKTSRVLVFATLSLALSVALRAEGPYHNRDNKNPRDSGEGTYPIPYQLPTVQEVTATIARVRDFLDATAPTRVIDSATGKEITDFSQPVATAVLDRGPMEFSPLAYEMGVVHSAMLKAAEVTGDARFSDYTKKHLDFIARVLPFFRANAQKFGADRNGMRGVLEPRALDDCGSMCAALIRARQAHVGPDLKPVIDTWTDYIAHKQFRLSDGTLARQRPQAVSLWADDLYMGVPALAEMGRLTGDRAWFDDAVRVVEGMSSRLFNPKLNLYAHGWNANNPDAPQFYWGRADGWAVVTLCDLLDVLPADHPERAKVMAQLVAVLHGVAQLQSGSGMWHQLLDREDSYLETSATAMFTYGIAHAVNQGWLPPTTWGSIAQAGWCALTTRISDKGAVDGTCVGTTFAGDAVYYYARPAGPNALHGYGPTILAGVEMIKMLKNPAFTIDYKLRTYHYVPKNAATSYREHM